MPDRRIPWRSSLVHRETAQLRSFAGSAILVVRRRRQQ
jgi:hypothetical protein